MEITVTMSRAAYESYLRNGIKNKEALIEYLNKTGRYRGTVTDVSVDEDIQRNPFVKVEE